MTDLRTIGPKLAKLLPLLGSDKDGEVVATAKAIQRTLQSGGADWHDLAGAVQRVGLPAVKAQRKPRKPKAKSQPPAPPTRAARPWGAFTTEERLRLLDALINSGILTSWELQFATEIREYVHYKPGLAQSERQACVLDRLVTRLREKGARR
jgi:hypothetical protein